MSMSLFGHLMNSIAARSGSWGTNDATASSMGHYPGHGMYSVSFSSGMPGAVAFSDLAHSNALGIMVPDMYLDALHSSF